MHSASIYRIYRHIYLRIDRLTDERIQETKQNDVIAINVVLKWANNSLLMPEENATENFVISFRIRSYDDGAGNDNLFYH